MGAKERVGRTGEEDRGGAGGAVGGEGVLVGAIVGRVGEERGLDGIEGGRAEEAAGGRAERCVEGQEESGEEVEQRETEQLRLEDGWRR